MTRIAKLEIYYPAEGSPVYQVVEETTISGQVIRLDPRNPTGEELTAATNELTAAQATRIAELELQITALEKQVERLQADHDPRMIDPRIWQARFTPEESLEIALRSPEDATLRVILANLRESIALREADSSYQMSLDHVNAIQGIGYLQSAGILTAERVAELLSNSRPDEA